MDNETGDYGERRLEHPEGAEQFYRDLRARGVEARIGMEASGHSRWFERLFNAVSFFQVVPSAKKLNVHGGQRGPTFLKRHDVVKMQFVSGAADRALSAIAFPYFQLDLSRDQPSAFRIDANGLSEVFFTFDSHQLELEDGSVFVTLGPRIYEVEDTVVRPDPRTNLFVHSHSLRRALAALRRLSGCMKLAVLRKPTGRKVLRLVYDLRIWIQWPLR